MFLCPSFTVRKHVLFVDTLGPDTFGLNKVIVVRLMSAAGTGFYYTMKRQRVKEKMMLRKYDPIGKLQSVYSC